MQPPAILSPFSSPPNKEVKPRTRLPSNSEPELVPVVKKIDETPGYENVIRESQRGNAIKTRQPERKPEPRPLNGIETDPTLVSNLLKESLVKPVPITVPTEKKSPVEVKKEPVIETLAPPPAPPPQVEQPVQPPPVQPPQPAPTEESDHKHKKEKKKKDKHKHKDRDKSKEERKKHKKDKDKEKEKEKKPEPAPEPDGIRITIPREKLSSPGLKIKIPKERLAAPPPPPGLKIKISKDLLETSRKRPAVGEPGPPAKLNKVRPPFRPPLPYYMVRPPPPLYYYYPPMFAHAHAQAQAHAHAQAQAHAHAHAQHAHAQAHAQPPLPAMPPPPVPPPPPE